MDWLSTIEREHESISVHSEIFVFEETTEAVVYAEKLTELENDKSVFDIQTKENWDQAGILTILVTYKRRNRGK